MRIISAGPAGSVSGSIRVPGDKSISHRAIMFGAIARGRTTVTGFLPGEDCLATLAAVEAMGVPVTRNDATRISLEGVGLRGLRAPAAALDMGNSGTAMRLFAGLLSGQVFDSRLCGDESLSRRPMERVAGPLRQMGAEIRTTDGHAPLLIKGGRSLRGIRYDMPVASAQVKSAVLLAGLYAAGETRVMEPAVTRDHTERMLERFGQPVRRQGNTVCLQPSGELQGCGIDVPGDLSSATFMVLAGLAAPAGEVVIENVGLNPTRTGILEIFRLMGADLRVEVSSEADAEPVGRIIVKPSELFGAVIPPELVPLAIDEFPAVFVAAALARGDTVISGAEELRHKESDRISVMVAGLHALGVKVEETADGARIRGGGGLQAGEVDSRGDHRVAMAFAAAAVRARGRVRILDTANVATSFPGFVPLARQIGMDVEETGDGSPAGHG